jgi:hypothetical protein
VRAARSDWGPRRDGVGDGNRGVIRRMALPPVPTVIPVPR